MNHASPAPGVTGRFAPSPTGPLHFGSLVAAIGSYVEARRQHGRWLLRIDDLDRPREVAGASDSILHDLDALGLHWDGPVMYQSTRDQAYAGALRQLQQCGLVFDCACSRREVADSGLRGTDGPVYPGTCRSGTAGRPAHTLRVRTDHDPVGFHDALQGPVSQDLESEIGDFVVRRADGLYAYQLAVVVDDHAQGVTDVVRGADLLHSTTRQVYLQRLLGLPTPRYLHLPVAVDVHGNKLSKQTAAAPVDSRHPQPVLRAALAFLRQAVPDPDCVEPQAFWQEVIATWDPQRIPRTTRLPALPTA